MGFVIVPKPLRLKEHNPVTQLKDFDYLQDRRDLPSFGNEYLDNMVTVLKGDRWRQMRNILTPVFTGGKLKLMLPLIDQGQL